MTTENSGIDNSGTNDAYVSGGVASSNGNNAINVWQKVTNVKKQRRQAQKSAGGDKSEGVVGGAGKTEDGKVFQALESEAEERRARRNAKLAAAAAAAASTANGGELSHSGEEESDVEHGGLENGGLKSSEEIKKVKVKKQRKPKVSVADAAAAIDLNDLGTFLAGITESFEALPDVQLVRSADYFAHAFAPVTSAQFTWNKILREMPVAKTIEIPICYLPEPLIKTASEWLSKRPTEALSKFTLWLLKEILDDPLQAQLQKGSKGATLHLSKPKVGLLVILALVLRKKPEVLVLQAGTIRSQYQGLDKLYTLVWAYGQAAHGDLVAGLTLWIQNMLPLAVGKASTPASRDIVLQFIENVLFANLKKARPILLDGAMRKGERLVPPLAYDSLLRVTYPPESARTKATERFQSIFPIVKEIALAGSQRSKATKPVAQQLLPLSFALISDEVVSLSSEACNNFVWCLSQNSGCYKQWEKLYMDNLKASIRILNFLLQDWKQHSNRLSSFDDLKKTIQIMLSKNRQTLDSKKGDVELESQLKASDIACKAITRKLSRGPSCAKAVATVVLSVGIAYAAYQLNPNVNPWNWDGGILLSKTHPFI